MTAFHDAYLLNLEMFASKIAPYLGELRMDRGYEQLRLDAIRLYENNSHIRHLLSDYGGWDRNSILTQIPDSSPYDQEDVAFWLIILLYSELRTGQHQMGFGSDRKLAQDTLTRLGWLDNEVELLIKGRSFKDFAQVWFPGEVGIAGYWDHARPSSTAAWAGWLDRTEVERLLTKLNEDEQKLLKLTGEIAEADPKAVDRVYGSAKDMLFSATRSNCGLCLIISG